MDLCLWKRIARQFFSVSAVSPGSRKSHCVLEFRAKDVLAMLVVRSQAGRARSVVVSDNSGRVWRAARRRLSALLVGVHRRASVQ